MLTRRILVASGPVLLAGAAARAVPLPDTPPGACDCHVHIIGPQDRYPMVASRAYTPPGSSVAELLALRARLGLARTVLIQPSFYGTDNSAMLDALAGLGGTAAGIAVVAPDVSDGALAAFDRAGVRGIRINVESGGGHDPREVMEPLAALAHRMAPLNWHVQIYATLSVIARIAPAVADLPVPVVFDHFGMPDAALGPEQPGFPALLDLLRTGRTYVKLSAPYRISRLTDYSDVLPIARALIAAGPRQLVWASDWPHTDRTPGAAPTTVSPFRVVDDGAVLAMLADWCPDPAQRRVILTETPARLYRFS